MIYLFNSAYRALYTTNVLNTLYLPSGFTNEYRYRYRSDEGTTQNVNISPNNLAIIEAVKPGEAVSIIFIDRFGDDGYVYHPLRLGSLIRTWKENNRCFFKIKLEKYIYPKNVADFNNKLVEKLRTKDIPKLTEDDAKNPNDGQYAFQADDLFTPNSDFFGNDEAWTNVVEKLRNCKAFTYDESESPSGEPIVEYIFIKCDLVKKASQDSITPVTNKGNTFYKLNKGDCYDLKLSYRYPAQLENSSNTGIIECKAGDNIRFLGKNEIDVDSSANRDSLPFATKRFTDDTSDGISLDFISKQSEHVLIGPNSRLILNVNESISVRVQAVIALVLLIIASVIIGSDLPKLGYLNFLNETDGLFDANRLLSTVRAFVLLWLFILFGKKVF